MPTGSVFWDLSSFRNVNGLEKDLNYATTVPRCYSVNVNSPTLEDFLTVIRQNSSTRRQQGCLTHRRSNRKNGRGQAIWRLNENVALVGEGIIVNCEDYGLEWISHLTEGDRKFIAKRGLTTAVSDEEVVKHFKEVIAPYVIETLLTEGLGNSISSTFSQSVAASSRGRDTFLSSQDFKEQFTNILERTMRGLTRD